MAKRLMLMVVVVGAFFVLAVPAFAFNGLRGDYTTSDYCSVCHQIGQPGTAPKVFDAWQGTKHAIDEEGPSAVKGLPNGSTCGGCHSSNYAPSKVTPSPTATSTANAVSWGASVNTVTLPQADASSPSAARVGDAPFSEAFIGCSSCHYGVTTGSAPQFGNDANDTAHMAPGASMANADICGQCHSRYSYTANTITVSPIPYVTLTGTPAVPKPNPSPTTLIQPQMAIGFNPFGLPTAWVMPALSTNLIVSQPGWTPAPAPDPTSTAIPNPGVTSAAGLMLYWKDTAGKDTMWQRVGHDGSAAQYPEWKSEGHATALQDLKDVMGPNPPATCLQCHSTDYRIAKAGHKPTGAQSKYGVTCVGCHTPHDAGTVKGVWDEEFDSQLIGDTRSMCTDCHNGELPTGATASPGATVHHPMKELMNGTGAIDVAGFPSVHKGKCIQCHMPPTSLSRGATQKGGNHTFDIIMPQEAVDASPVPYATATAKPTATPTVSGTTVATTTVTITQDGMPFSACSTCHNKVDAVKDEAEVVSTVTTTPSPLAVPRQETVTIVQDANGSAVANMNAGDKALWLQDTIDQRQEWTHDKIDQVNSELNAAAIRLGYANTAAAQAAIVAIPAANRSADQTNFLKAFTNISIVDSEGSYGIHNWDYSRMIVNTALFEAQSVMAPPPAPTPWTVTIKSNKTTYKYNKDTIKITGGVAPATSLAWGEAKVTIQKKTSTGWSNWKNMTCDGSGNYAKSWKASSKGTVTIRCMMPANSRQLVGYSSTIKFTVK